MSERLVLMACTGNHTTPWHAVQPGDSAISVVGLGEGEHIVVETKTQRDVLTSDGVIPLPPGPTFRVHKEHSCGSSTFVRVTSWMR